MFPRNFWYVAAWDTEIRRQELLRRTICSEPIVFYRREDGTPVALEDRCCHRHMPLSDGVLKGDNIECLYHGLTYDPSGTCIHIPSQTTIPPEAKVRSYPVFEKHHWIWIWMGEPALATRMRSKISIGLTIRIGARKARSWTCRAIISF